MKLRLFFAFSLLLHLLFFIGVGFPFSPPKGEKNSIEVIETLATTPASDKQSSSKTNKKMTQKPSEKVLSESPPAETGRENSGSQSPEAVGVTAVTEAPRVLQEKQIAYPEAARRAGIEGLVEMQLVIDNQGHVQTAEVSRGLGYGLDEAALQAIREFLFSPARIGSETVPVRIVYKYRFRLHR